MSSPAVLSPNDAQTLNLLFQPDQSAVPPKPPVDESITQNRYYSLSTLESLLKTEAQAVSLAESSPQQAVDLFNSLIESHPQYASAYNNRAQLLRLTPSLSPASTQILEDLDKAIALASPEIKGGKVSPSDGRVLKNAYSQRGAVWVQRKEDEKAMRDFEQAAQWGSEVGREYVVKNNPYAKMCGEMVKEVLRKEMGM